MAAGRAALRRAVLELVLLVVLVDVVFVAIYYWVDLAHASRSVTLPYTVIWMAVTLAVVLRGLGRVRAERLRLRSGR
jgi:hypothetical protein